MEGLKKCMNYIFILSLAIVLGIFITDWFFTRDKDLLNDTIVGVMLGAPIGWFGSFVAYYTTEKVSEARHHDDSDRVTSHAEMLKKENDDATTDAPPSSDH